LISQKALSAERDEKEREAEQIALEEEMRKRRERVRAWQLEKAARLVAESNENPSNVVGAADVDRAPESTENEANGQNNGPHWTLEDDDEDEGDGEDAPDGMDLEKSQFAEEASLLAPITAPSEQEDVPLPFTSAAPVLRPSVPPSPQIHIPAPLADELPVDQSIIRKPASSRFNRSQQSILPEPTPSPASVPQPSPKKMEAPKVEMDSSEVDPLDAFMASLYDTGDVTEQNSQPSSAPTPRTAAAEAINPFGSNFITLDQIMGRSLNGNGNAEDAEERSVQEWESEIAFSPAPQFPLDSSADADAATAVDLEKEERERREFLEALRATHVTRDIDEEGNETPAEQHQPATKTEEIGRIFAGEGDLIDESEMEAKKKSALEILEDAKRAKELKPLDHSTVEYMPFRKNLYIVPRVLAKLPPEEVAMVRGTLQIKVRGKGCPVPVENWDQCGLSERILSIINKHNLVAPFSIQKQAIPAIMCGRDIIAVAKTGSGKTLAFLLPLFRHILDQPPLRDGEGPIGLIMAPARELAFQITNEAKKFTKALGLRVACIYGGAGVADQIAELKRGADIVVCTPGRMIDILCMQAGKLVSLRRVTFVVMVSSLFHLLLVSLFSPLSG
jgi:hypothetical protein